MRHRPILFACAAAVLMACHDEPPASPPVTPVSVDTKASSSAAPVASTAPDLAPASGPLGAVTAPSADPNASTAPSGRDDSEGIGLGNIGTLGTGHGRDGGVGAKPPVSLRQGATTVTGRLPPEVVQRIVRQNFGRFRLCYENGRKTNANLAGRVTTKFVIDGSGAVTSAKDSGSDLGDAGTISCVNKAFSNLSFPEPEDKKPVTVVYPVIFSTDATSAPPPPKPTK